MSSQPTFVSAPLPPRALAHPDTRRPSSFTGAPHAPRRTAFTRSLAARPRSGRASARFRMTATAPRPPATSAPQPEEPRSGLERLPRKPGFPKRSGPVALIIMDGVGDAPATAWNAVTSAYTPFLDSLRSGSGPHGSTSLYTQLEASGQSVGLPSMSDMGNSEVGHNALGAGRVFDQGAKLVANAFDTGAFERSDTWRWLVDDLSNTAALHLIGLLSDGNIHAHVDHVYKMIDAAVLAGVSKIRLHVILDGRDVPERSALDYILPLEERLQELRDSGACDARIASGGGRMVVTMDRYEAEWRMVERGWRAHVLGDTDTTQSFPSAADAVRYFYENDESTVDQYMPPFVVVDGADEEAVGPVHDGDSVLFWNFRGDRSIEVSQAFETSAFDSFPYFDRVRVPNVRYAGMMQYDGDANIPNRYLVPPPHIDRTLGEFAAAHGLSRLSVSETQKFGHVTYFFNGNRSSMFDTELETYTCVPSYTAREHTRPWMRAAEISDEVCTALTTQSPDLIIVNYPNGDMVGHTGSMVAARMAVEAVDLCLARVVPEIIKHDGVVLLTADHGNCDVMAETDKKTGAPKKGSQPEGWKAKVSHTNAKVPFYVVGRGVDRYEFDEEAKWSDTNEHATGGGIANIASTILNLLGLSEPVDYLPPLLKVKDEDDQHVL